MSGPVVPAVALCRYGAGRPCLRVHFTGGRPGRDVVYHHQDGGTESDRAASRIRVRVEWFHGSWNEDTAAARAFRAFWSLRWCVSAGRAGGAASPASLGKRQVSGSIPLTGSHFTPPLRPSSTPTSSSAGCPRTHPKAARRVRATMTKLLDEYAAIVPRDVSTRQTSEGFIRRAIKPALGP